MPVRVSGVGWVRKSVRNKVVHTRLCVGARGRVEEGRGVRAVAVGEPQLSTADQPARFENSLPGRRGTVQVRVCGIVWRPEERARGKAGGGARNKHMSCRGPLYVTGTPHACLALYRVQSALESAYLCLAGNKEAVVCLGGISKSPSTENSNVPFRTSQATGAKATTPSSPARSSPN